MQVAGWIIAGVGAFELLTGGFITGPLIALVGVALAIAGILRKRHPKGGEGGGGETS
jgi:hypothetical protein